LFVFDWQMEPFQAFGGEPSPKQLRLWWHHSLVESTKVPVEEAVVSAVANGGRPEANVDARSPAHGIPGEQARPSGQPLAELVRPQRAPAVVVASGLKRQSQVADPAGREHLYFSNKIEPPPFAKTFFVVSNFY
jgi:hypothetical protein